MREISTEYEGVGVILPELGFGLIIGGYEDDGGARWYWVALMGPSAPEPVVGDDDIEGVVVSIRQDGLEGLRLVRFDGV